MIVTLILRLHADAVDRGDLHGWAELIRSSETGIAPERLPLDGVQSLVAAAAAALSARRVVSSATDDVRDREEPTR